MNSEQARRIDIVIPFLNERENLPVIVERVEQAFAERAESWRILFVDDGSTDDSARWVADRAKDDHRISLLRLSRNFGHQVAITAGLDEADGDAVIIMDADLQDPPEVIPDLLDAWQGGLDVVYAVRSRREGESWLKKFLAAGFYRLFHALAKVEVPMNAGDFRLVDRKVVDAVREVRELHRFMRGLTSWVGFEQGAVHYERAARHAGKTKYPVWKSLNLAWDAITSFTGAPLRWMTGMGIVVAFAGLLLALQLIIRKFLQPEMLVQGWTTVVSLILTVGGIQLLCLGLLGQYVGRTFEESKKRPLYFIRERIGIKNSK